MENNHSLFHWVSAKPTILVTGAIGKSDVIHMLTACIAYGALSKDIHLMEVETANGAKADLIIDTDLAVTNDICRMEDVVYKPDCGCFLAHIGSERVMVKVAMPGVHAVKHAMIVMQAVDVFGGDLAKASMALANLSPRVGFGKTQRIGSINYAYTLMDYTKHASMLTFEAALGHMSMLEKEHMASTILVIGEMEDALPDHLACLLNQYGIDRILTLDKVVALAAKTLGLHVELFDEVAFLNLRLERLVSVGDILMIIGQEKDGLGSLVSTLEKQEDIMQKILPPLAAE